MDHNRPDPQRELFLKYRSLDYSTTTAFQVLSPQNVELHGDHFVLEQLLVDPPLHEALSSSILRKKVDCLPLLDCRELGLEQQRRAFKILSFVSTGYIWSDGSAAVLGVLPPQLAIPLQQLAAIFGCAPIANYATTVLWNCHLKDITQGWIPENVHVDVTFTGTWDEHWFYAISACVEVAGAEALNSLITLATLITDAKLTSVKFDLSAAQGLFNRARISLQKMAALLARAFEMNSKTFYWKMRPYFAGWSIVDVGGILGVHYAGVDDPAVYQQYSGISAAQSSLFQSLDILLGVRHDNERARFLRGVRIHMPGKHQVFIQRLEDAFSGVINSFAAETAAFQSSYNDLVEALASFRGLHIRAATKYAVEEAKRDGMRPLGLAVTSGDGGGAIGAGGSLLQPFLQGLIINTRMKALLENKLVNRENALERWDRQVITEPSFAPLTSTAVSTDHILLVPYEERHVPLYHKWMQDKDIQTATASEPLSVDEEYAMQRSWRTDGDKLTFIVCKPLARSADAASTSLDIQAGIDDAADRMLGDINLFITPSEHDAEILVGELELMIAETASQGKGHGRAALLAFLKYVTTYEEEILREYKQWIRKNDQHLQPEQAFPFAIDQEASKLGGVGERLVGSTRFGYLRARIGKDNLRSMALFEVAGFCLQSTEPNYFGELEMRMKGHFLGENDEQLTREWWGGSWRVNGWKVLKYQQSIAS